MISFILWYLVITTIGLLSFPIAYRLLPKLPDRGYSLSRILGLLIWGYVFWMLASFGFLHNTPGGLMLALAIVLGVSVWLARDITREELSLWWKKKWYEVRETWRNEETISLR